MNLFYNKDGMIVYHAAALGIVYDKTKHVQYFFHGHDDDITALAMNPKDKVIIAHASAPYAHRPAEYATADRYVSIVWVCTAAGDDLHGSVGQGREDPSMEV